MASLATYPTDLPLPQVQGYQQVLSKHFDSTPVERGAPFFREFDNLPPWRVNVQWLFNNKNREFTRFQDWYINTLVFGSKWFTMELLIGEALWVHECHFADPDNAWAHTPMGILHQVNSILVAKYDTDAIYSVPRADLDFIDAGDAAGPAGDIVDAGADSANPPANIIDGGLARDM